MFVCKNEQCFGCSACYAICPVKAIAMSEDEFGAFIPVIDKERCIDCGACRRVCPAINDNEKNGNGECYAAWSKDSDTLKSSASAGIVSVLSQQVIIDGGVVFGVRYDNKKLIYDYTETADGIKDFCGSKYVHADVGEAFIRVKEFLNRGRRVLFVGTPCIVAGLKRFLNKEYDNLLTVDLICHGVAPQRYLEEYIKRVIAEKEYDNILFRGRDGMTLAVYNHEKIVYKKEKLADLFYNAYAKGIIHRENCYTCPFADKKRVGDITAGDFWGLDRANLKTASTNVPFISLVITNTEKGRRAFEHISDNIVFEKRSIDEAVPFNKQLERPSIRHEYRDTFLNKYKQVGFLSALKASRVYKETKKTNLLYNLIAPLRKIKKLIKK